MAAGVSPVALGRVVPTGLAAAVRAGKDSGGGGLRLVFELLDDAFRRRYVATFAEVDGLIDGTAFLEGVEVSHFRDFIGCGHFMVGRDGDVAGGNEVIAIVETDGDAALFVAAEDDKTRGFHKLVFELGTAGVGTTRAVRRIDVLEDHSFALGLAEFFIGLNLVVRGYGGADPAQRGLLGRDHHDETGEAVDVTTLAHVMSFDFEEVEGMEDVTNRFAIDEQIVGDLRNGLTDGFRDGDDESAAVDAGDGIALFADHEPSSVDLFLEAVFFAEQEMGQLFLVDGIEELAADAAITSFIASLGIGSLSFRTVSVAFGGFGGDEFGESLGGFGETHRMLGLGSSREGVAAAAVGEADDVTFTARFDGGVIDFVGVSFAVLEGGGLECGACGCHGMMGLV